jgi:hypothetical protein
MSKSQCVWKLHSACINHTRARRYHTRESHIHTHACQNYSRVSGNLTLRVKSHSACDNRTLHVEINLVRVEITLIRACRYHTARRIYTLRVRVTFERVDCRMYTREYHIYTHTCQTYSRVCRKHTLRVKSHSACGNLTLRVETNLVRVEITLCV